MKTRKTAAATIFRTIPLLLVVALGCGGDSVGPVSVTQEYRLVMYGDSPIPARLTHPSEAVQRFFQSGQLTLRPDGTYQRIDQFRSVSGGVGTLDESTESSTYCSAWDSTTNGP